MRGNGRLGRIALARIAAGTLFLQAAFEPGRKQALGVSAALLPAARLWPPGEPRRSFHRRHLEPFNTNPAMAGPILGGVARMEEDAAAEGTDATEPIRRFKMGLEGPFAAWGDAILWNGCRPGFAFAGSALAWIAGGWGVLAFLLLYNAVHLGLRVGGVFWGYAKGREVFRLLESPLLAGLRSVAAWLVPAAALAVVLVGWRGSGGHEVLGAAAMGIGFAGGAIRGPRGVWIGPGGIIVGLLAAFLVGGV